IGQDTELQPALLLDQRLDGFDVLASQPLLALGLLGALANKVLDLGEQLRLVGFGTLDFLLFLDDLVNQGSRLADRNVLVGMTFPWRELSRHLLDERLPMALLGLGLFAAANGQNDLDA